MQRVAMKSPGAPLEMQQVDIPEPAPKGVVVKTQYCGICHSDVMWLTNGVDAKQHPDDMFAMRIPATMGHEVSGQIYKIGKDVDDPSLKVGDDVFVYPWIGCGDCFDCANDRTQACLRKGFMHKVGWHHDGGFAAYVMVSESKYAVKAPAAIPMNRGCMLTCSGLTTFSAVSKITPYFEEKRDHQTLLVIGAGGLGLFCLQFAKALLPQNTRIISADIEKTKLDIALEHGADDVILWDNSKTIDGNLSDDDDLLKKMKEKSGAAGFDGIIDIVGSPATVSRALKGLKVDGAYVLVGLFGGEVTINLRPFLWKVPNIHAIRVGSFSNFVKMIAMVTETPIKYPPVTYFKQEELPAAIEKLIQRKINGRGILKYY